MNCQAPLPFADNDPFLPRQDAPNGPCPTCGEVHRLDFGCGETVDPVVFWLALGAALVFVFLATAALAAWGCS